MSKISELTLAWQFHFIYFDLWHIASLVSMGGESDCQGLVASVRFALCQIMSYFIKFEIYLPSVCLHRVYLLYVPLLVGVGKDPTNSYFLFTNQNLITHYRRLRNILYGYHCEVTARNGRGPITCNMSVTHSNSVMENSNRWPSCPMCEWKTTKVTLKKW